MFDNPEIPDMRVRERQGWKNSLFLGDTRCQRNKQSQLWEQQGLLALLFVEIQQCRRGCKPPSLSSIYYFDCIDIFKLCLDKLYDAISPNICGQASNHRNISYRWSMKIFQSHLGNHVRVHDRSWLLLQTMTLHSSYRSHDRHLKHRHFQ